MSTTPDAISKFHFTLRELLGATALLAVGFTWPLVMIFVVPLLVAAILSRIGLGSFAPIAVATALSMTLGVVFSLLHWRYPFRPPTLLPELQKISAIEQLSLVSDINPLRGAGTIVAVAALPTVISPQGYADHEYPIHRLLQHLSRQHVAIESIQPLSSQFVDSLWNAAELKGLLVDGRPERINTKTLGGHVGIARLNSGERIAFAALSGDEYSNDHYPYYEYVVPLDDAGLEIANSQWFYYDVAGIEGATWNRVAIACFIVLGPIGFLIQFVLFATKRDRFRTLVRAAAPT